MKKKITPFVVLPALVAVGAFPLRAQVSGATISGIITDPQAGAIANARVAATNVATSVLTDTNTNSAGAYTIPNLIPGDYQVAVSANGFSTAATKLTLTVGQKQELNLSLSVGQVSTQVEVAGAAEQVELSNSTVAGMSTRQRCASCR